MTSENGNGEVRQLLEIKRAYRKGLTTLEGQLKADYERDLADGKKKLKEKYLENVVDVVFTEPAPPATVEVEAKEATIALRPEVKLDVKVSAPGVCPECQAKVDTSDKFCSQCAFPLTESVETEVDMSDFPVVSAGRKFRARVRR
jgi:hypothetical protein